jgi:hypothetical protein
LFISNNNWSSTSSIKLNCDILRNYCGKNIINHSNRLNYLGCHVTDITYVPPDRGGSCRMAFNANPSLLTPVAHLQNNHLLRGIYNYCPTKCCSTVCVYVRAAMITGFG